MTVREQLTERVVAIRAAWALIPPPAMPWVEEITLECRPGMLPAMALVRDALGRVNAGFVGLANAGHLLVKGCKTEQIVADGETTFRNTVRIAYRLRPWRSILMGWDYPTADFDAMLDALDGVAEPAPERLETWHDRPGML